MKRKYKSAIMISAYFAKAWPIKSRKGGCSMSKIEKQQGTYGVMELQPGQVNWGSINPQPLPGAIRLWMWRDVYKRQSLGAVG